MPADPNADKNTDENSQDQPVEDPPKNFLDEKDKEKSTEPLSEIFISTLGEYHDHDTHSLITIGKILSHPDVVSAIVMKNRANVYIAFEEAVEKSISELNANSQSGKEQIEDLNSIKVKIQDALTVKELEEEEPLSELFITGLKAFNLNYQGIGLLAEIFMHVRQRLIPRKDWESIGNAFEEAADRKIEELQKEFQEEIKGLESNKETIQVALDKMPKNTKKDSSDIGTTQIDT
jgi:hypothetical protein